MKKSDQVEILPYDPAYREDFKRLNIEWLEAYFRVEEADEKILSDPEKYILAPGGVIFFARRGGEIVGACALTPRGNGAVALSRMGVTQSHRGKGIGRKLLAEAIRWYEKSGAAFLCLESNTRLEAAIGLYESVGFAHAEHPEPPTHERSNVYMIYGE